MERASPPVYNMRFHLGAIPLSSDFDTTAWTPLSEPSAAKMQLYAAPIALVSYMLVCAFWSLKLDVPFPKLVFGASLLHLAAVCVGVVIIHELLHAAVQPGFPAAPQCMIGVWPARGLFFAHYLGAMSRERFLLVFAIPLLVITILPMLLAVAFSFQPRVLAIASTLNAAFACGDVFGMALIWWQVPRGARVRNQGWHTYWQPAPA